MRGIKDIPLVIRLADRAGRLSAEDIALSLATSFLSLALTWLSHPFRPFWHYVRSITLPAFLPLSHLNASAPLGVHDSIIRFVLQEPARQVQKSGPAEPPRRPFCRFKHGSQAVHPIASGDPHPTGQRCRGRGVGSRGRGRGSRGRGRGSRGRGGGSTSRGRGRGRERLTRRKRPCAAQGTTEPFRSPGAVTLAANMTTTLAVSLGWH